MSVSISTRSFVFSIHSFGYNLVIQVYCTNGQADVHISHFFSVNYKLQTPSSLYFNLKILEKANYSPEKNYTFISKRGFFILMGVKRQNYMLIVIEEIMAGKNKILDISIFTQNQCSSFVVFVWTFWSSLINCKNKLFSGSVKLFKKFPNTNTIKLDLAQSSTILYPFLQCVCKTK